jgi:lipid-A-disaccharide synthase
LKILRDRTYEIMAHADVVIVASGTATLETALLGTPMVIVYRVSPITFLIGKALVKLPYVGLVNILAGKHIVPEHLQADCNPNTIAESVRELLSDEVLRGRMEQDLKRVAGQLGDSGATERAAEAALSFLESRTGSG